jgi:glycosyltransferase involved in cell wall biosynthesis
LARIALVHDIAGVAAVQAELLRKAGHEVDEIDLPAVGAGWSWPAKALALPFRFAAYLPAANRLRRGKYDVVHIHWLSQGVVGLLARRSFFVQAHGSDLHLNLRNAVYRRVTASVLKRARKIFYVTPNLLSFLGDYSDKAIYLPNPVDLRGVAVPLPAPKEVARVVIFTRLDPVKGVEHIFPAAERLRANGLEITALDWGPLARDYVRKYGQSVRFVKTVPHPTVGSFLSEFDVVIGQMRQGILSLMEIEALAAGRPLVTAVNWELYPDDPPPVLHAGTADEIASVVTSLKANPSELARLSREGREWAVRNHSYAHHLQLLEASYFGTPH